MSYVYRPTIAFCPASLDACALWRMFFPHLRIKNSRFMFTGGCPNIDEICESDIVCLQRMLTEANMKFIQTVVSLGMRLVYDLDDNIWQIPDTNYAKIFFGTNDIQNGMMHCAEWAHVLTVSTPTLKRVVNRYWGHLRNVATKKPIPIIVCENRVDPTFLVPKERENEFITIGWAGSNTHHGDLVETWPVLYRILEKYPNVRVELVGHTAPFKHPRLGYREWVHISEYLYALSEWNWDIMLAPLEEHKFNESKSNIKMQEAGALYRPCLATYIRPYIDFCRGDKELEWQLCPLASRWENRLAALIEDADLRKGLGKKMREHVVKNFHIEDTVYTWANIAEAALEHN